MTKSTNSIGLPQSRLINTGLASALMLAAMACTESAPTEPSVGIAFDRVQTAVVCHVTPDGGYRQLELNARAADAHRSHGDAMPGEVVPGMPGYRFDGDCQPVPAARYLTGEWAGTYAWACGGSQTGSTPIRFVLSDPGTGRISGTASYLGGTAPVQQDGESYRVLEPVLRADGTWLGGDMDPGGMYIHLTVGADEGFFVNNVFDGVIASDFNRMAGHTMNGDSATPLSPGCSAPSGASGSFSITRVQ